LRTLATSPSYAGKTAPEIPYLHACVTEDESTGQVVVFALNRHLSEPMDLDVLLRGFGGGRRILEAQQIHHPNMKAVNTRDAQTEVAPAPIQSIAIAGDRLTARLMPGSWNVIVTAPA